MDLIIPCSKRPLPQEKNSPTMHISLQHYSWIWAFLLSLSVPNQFQILHSVCLNPCKGNNINNYEFWLDKQNLNLYLRSICMLKEKQSIQAHLRIFSYNVYYSRTSITCCCIWLNGEIKNAYPHRVSQY